MIPGREQIEREIAAMPGLGELQAIRRIQARETLIRERRTGSRAFPSEARPIVADIVERSK